MLTILLFDTLLLRHVDRRVRKDHIKSIRVQSIFYLAQRHKLQEGLFLSPSTIKSVFL